MTTRPTPWTRAGFLAIIERHIERTGESATAFGRRVLNDPDFVHGVRRGGKVFLDTAERVMRTIPKRHGGLMEPPPKDQSRAA